MQVPELAGWQARAVPYAWCIWRPWSHRYTAIAPSRMARPTSATRCWRHLEAVVREYVEHYNSHRPHRSLGQLPPKPKGMAPAVLRNVDASQLQRDGRLGGVIHEYRLAA